MLQIPKFTKLNYVSFKGLGRKKELGKILNGQSEAGKTASQIL